MRDETDERERVMNFMMINRRRYFFLAFFWELFIIGAGDECTIDRIIAYLLDRKAVGRVR